MIGLVLVPLEQGPSKSGLGQPEGSKTEQGQKEGSTTGREQLVDSKTEREQPGDSKIARAVQPLERGLYRSATEVLAVKVKLVVEERPKSAEY